MLCNSISYEEILSLERVNDLLSSLVVSIHSSSFHHLLKPSLNQHCCCVSCHAVFNDIVFLDKVSMDSLHLELNVEHLHPKNSKNSFPKLDFSRWDCSGSLKVNQLTNSFMMSCLFAMKIFLFKNSSSWISFLNFTSHSFWNCCSF